MSPNVKSTALLIFNYKRHNGLRGVGSVYQFIHISASWRTIFTIPLSDTKIPANFLHDRFLIALSSKRTWREYLVLCKLKSSDSSIFVGRTQIFAAFLTICMARQIDQPNRAKIVFLQKADHICKALTISFSLLSRTIFFVCFLDMHTLFIS